MSGSLCHTWVCNEKSQASGDARFWCTQVGYGLVRRLDLEENNKRPKRPKPPQSRPQRRKLQGPSGEIGPGHLRPVILKPVGRIFGISDSNPIQENAENADVPPTPGKQGSEEIPQNENAENAETKTQKMRMTGSTQWL